MERRGGCWAQKRRGRRQLSHHAISLMPNLACEGTVMMGIQEEYMV